MQIIYDLVDNICKSNNCINNSQSIIITPKLYRKFYQIRSFKKALK